MSHQVSNFQMKKTKEVNNNEIITNLDEINIIADAMMEKKGKDILSLDLRRIGTAFTDHFVICNADTPTQVVAICDYVEEMMEKKADRPAVRKQGRENGFWIILDYTDIVVHIFKTEQRLFYRLEDLWADAVKTVYEED